MILTSLDFQREIEVITYAILIVSASYKELDGSDCLRDREAYQREAGTIEGTLIS